MPRKVLIKTTQTKIVKSSCTRIDKITEKRNKFVPTFNDVYRHVIKPLKEQTLNLDPTAIFQIEEIKKRGRFKILLKLKGSNLSAGTLSHIDPNYNFNGKYYIYCFRCNSLDIKETIESYEEFEQLYQSDESKVAIYEKRPIHY